VFARSSIDWKGRKKILKRQKTLVHLGRLIKKKSGDRVEPLSLFPSRTKGEGLRLISRGKRRGGSVFHAGRVKGTAREKGKRPSLVSLLWAGRKKRRNWPWYQFGRKAGKDG